jgi:hypothetical protein
VLATEAGDGATGCRHQASVVESAAATPRRAVAGEAAVAVAVVAVVAVAEVAAAEGVVVVGIRFRTPAPAMPARA